MQNIVKSLGNGLDEELREALAGKQLFMQYQPVVDFPVPGVALRPSDRNAAVEALVRWNHRIRGAVSPLEFINVAEQSGLIDALSDLVFTTACRQFVRWQEEVGTAAPRRLAVNVSRGQLSQAGFVGLVGDILDVSGMPPEALQIEVNETLAARDERLQNRLRELKRLGVRLAVDNFGTGDSSLVGLHRLPVDLVKIDRSFVAAALHSERHRVLIDATVRVAHSVGMQCGAEGIETDLQLGIVRELGCRSGQGFFFGEAMSAAHLSQWLAAV
jgi:EAL domain-containing protein (putative c-di-GMP-specific phosphodiesterase class I)